MLCCSPGTLQSRISMYRFESYKVFTIQCELSSGLMIEIFVGGACIQQHVLTQGPDDCVHQEHEIQAIIDASIN